MLYRVTFQLARIFTELEGFRDVQVTRVFPVGDNIGVDYEVTVGSSSSVMVDELNEFFAAKTELDDYLGNTDLLLMTPGGKE